MVMGMNMSMNMGVNMGMGMNKSDIIRCWLLQEF